MLEIRLHGRGGQGIVTAAEILVSAALKDGKYGLCRPIFGAERRGAPVLVIIRIDEKPVLASYQPKELDIIGLFDITLLKFIDPAKGLKEKGLLIINAPVPPEKLKRFNSVCVDAVSLAVKHKLGSLRDPIINTGTLGAFAKAGVVSFDSLLDAVKERFPDEKNLAVVKESFETAKFFAAAEAATEVSQEPAKSEYAALREKARAMIENGEMLLPTSLAQNMNYNKTGAWRTTGRPVLKDKSQCSKCGFCWFYCPDAAIDETEDEYPQIDYDFCKGCGICAEICPKKAIIFEEE